MKRTLMALLVRNIVKSVISVFALGLFAGCTIGYKNDGKEVTWNSWNEGRGRMSFKIDADPVTFKPLAGSYGCDSKHVFFRGDVVTDADPETFKILKDGYAFDKGQAYYCGHVLQGAEGGYLKSLGEWYAADKRQVYFMGEVVVNADPATFKVHTYYLTEDKSDFYWQGNALHVQDKPSFTLLGKKNSQHTCWGKDKHNAYFLEGKTIRGIDYATFHPVVDKEHFLSGHYAADKDRVYFKDRIVTGADPSSFKEVDFEVGQDIHGVYQEERATQLKDYALLKTIGRYMYSDGSNIYDTHFRILPNADVSTFENIKDCWYCDGDRVWWSNRPLPSVDAETFRPVLRTSFRDGVRFTNTDFNYGCDKNRVFFKDSIVEGADPVSFEIVDFNDRNGRVVFDKSRIYKGKDTPTFRRYFKERFGKEYQ